MKFVKDSSIYFSEETLSAWDKNRTFLGKCLKPYSHSYKKTILLDSDTDDGIVKEMTAHSIAPVLLDESSDDNEIQLKTGKRGKL